MGILDKIKKTKDEPKDVSKEAEVKVAKKEVKKTTKTTAAKKTTKKKTTTKTETVATANATSTGGAYKVLIRSLVSEKAATQETIGQYTFVVARDANKTQIKNAVESVYGVRPQYVKTMNMDGKKTSFGRRMGRRADWKKAIVHLPKGQTISIHEGV